MRQWITLATIVVAVTVTAGARHLAAGSSESADRKGVERAVLDYCEAFYEMKPELLRRSVHPDLAKFGFYRDAPDDDYRMIPMTFQQLLDLAPRWNKDGTFGRDAPKEVVVLDLLDKTASAKLTAGWGIDYLHLVKYDSKWQIVQVVWQSHPMNSD